MTPGQIEKKEAFGRELAQVHFGRLYRAQGRAILAYALRAMSELGDEDRELLLLISWEELSPGEAARVLGISSLAARSRLHRARRRLRTLLEQRESAAGQNPELDMEEAR